MKNPYWCPCKINGPTKYGKAKKLPNCLKLMNSFKPKNLMKYKNYPFFSLCSFSKIYKYVLIFAVCNFELLWAKSYNTMK